MRLQFTMLTSISLLYLLVITFASASPTLVHDLDIRSSTCLTSATLADIATLRLGVANPQYFCAWYLADGRTRSPLSGLSETALVDACKCLRTGKTSIKFPVAPKTKSFSPACPPLALQKLKNEFRDPTSFCKFYYAYPRDTSPMQDLGALGLSNACACTLGLVSTSTTSSIATSSGKVTSSSNAILSFKVTSSSRVTSSSVITSSLKTTASSMVTPSSIATSSTVTTYSKVATTTTSSKASSITSSTTASSTTTSILADITSIILAHKDQPFCSSLLGYHPSTTTATNPLTSVVVSTDAEASTTTDTITMTVTDTSISTQVDSTTVTNFLDVTSLTTETDVTTLTVTASALVDKRTGVAVALQTPTELSPYNSAQLSSACSAVVASPTSVVTIQATSSILSTSSKETNSVYTSFLTLNVSSTVFSTITLTTSISNNATIYDATATVTDLATSYVTVSSTTSSDTAAATCTAVVDGYTRVYQGYGVTENVMNPGNDASDYPMLYTSLDGTLSDCDALAQCGTISYADPSIYYSFDLHYVISNSSWVCVQIYDPNTDTSYFNVANSDVSVAYGYSINDD